MSLHNLGHVASLLVNAVRDAHDQINDVAAFDAVQRAVRNRINSDWRELVEAIEGSTGYSAEELIAEFEARVNAKFIYYSDVLAPLHAAIEYRASKEAGREALKFANRARLPGGLSAATIALRAQKKAARAVQLAA